MLQTDSLQTIQDTASAYQHVDFDSIAIESEPTEYHGFSVWRIAQQLAQKGEYTDQQLDSAVQANLPVRERVRSDRPDTLSIPGLPGRKPYEAQNDRIIDFNQGYFSNKAMFHPELPYRSMGKSAVPLPYMLLRDDWVTGGLLLCFVMLVLSINKMRKHLRQQSKDFFFPPREKPGLLAVETGSESRARLFMLFQLCLLGGIIMFAYSQHELNFFLGQLSPRWLLGIYVISFIAFFILKLALERLVNWVFFPKFQQKIWNDSYSFIISVESILFFPLAITFVYFSFQFEKIAIIFLFILLIIKILIAFKAYRIFFPKFHCLLHLFAYLCALEIMPLLALWKSLAILTEHLIVKY
ncbi:MAG: DUF4271 domain-containing protein [Bacteroidaceae bacterium]|nr:DUF4271 domain-containing protein [Bacteroidaceae bacterium]